jgi:8-oxo-dGTP diphosphatase
MIEPQQIGTCAILVNNQGLILLGKRKNGYKAGFFGLPGGRVEINEPLIKTIQREVKEETGIEVVEPQYLGVIRENQGGYDFIHFVFTARVGDAQPVLAEPDKCEDWEWFDLSKTLPRVLPGHVAAIDMFLCKEKLIDITS